MCQSKAHGGQRCHGHAKKALDGALARQKDAVAKASAAFAAGAPDADRLHERAKAAAAKVAKARAEYASTPEGEAALRAQIAGMEHGIAQQWEAQAALDEGLKIRAAALRSRLAAVSDPHAANFRHSFAKTADGGYQVLAAHGPNPAVVRKVGKEWSATDGWGTDLGTFPSREYAADICVFDDSGDPYDTECVCDGETQCSYPPCMRQQEQTAAHYAGLYAGRTASLSREEWDDVYSGDLGKQLAYDTHAAQAGGIRRIA